MSGYDLPYPNTYKKIISPNFKKYSFIDENVSKRLERKKELELSCKALELVEYLVR